MVLSFSGGNTYTPGVWKRVTITITPNPATNNVVKYGLQATARLSNNSRAAVKLPVIRQNIARQNLKRMPEGGLEPPT